MKLPILGPLTELVEKIDSDVQPITDTLFELSSVPRLEDKYLMGENIELDKVKTGPTNIDTPAEETTKKTSKARSLQNRFKAAALSAGIHLLPFIHAVVGGHNHTQIQIP